MDKKPSPIVNFVSRAEIAVGVIGLLFYLSFLAICKSNIITAAITYVVINLGVHLLLVLAILALTAGIFTLKLKPAGRILNLVLAATVILHSMLLSSAKILAFFYSPNQSFLIIIGFHLASIIAALCLIYIFLHPEVKQQFRNT